MNRELDSLISGFMDRLYNEAGIVTPDNLSKALEWLTKKQKKREINFSCNEFDRALGDLLKEFKSDNKFNNILNEYLIS